MVTESGADFSDLFLTLFGVGFAVFAASVLFFGRFTVATAATRERAWPTVSLGRLRLAIILVRERDSVTCRVYALGASAFYRRRVGPGACWPHGPAAGLGS